MRSISRTSHHNLTITEITPRMKAVLTRGQITSVPYLVKIFTNLTLKVYVTSHLTCHFGSWVTADQNMSIDLRLREKVVLAHCARLRLFIPLLLNGAAKLRQMVVHRAMENQSQIFLHGRCAFPWEVCLISLGMGFRTTKGPEHDLKLLQHRSSCTGNPTAYGQQVCDSKKTCPCSCKNSQSCLYLRSIRFRSPSHPRPSSDLERGHTVTPPLPSSVSKTPRYQQRYPGILIALPSSNLVKTAQRSSRPMSLVSSMPMPKKCLLQKLSTP